MVRFVRLWRRSMERPRYLFDLWGDFHPDRILNAIEPAVPPLQRIVRQVFEDMQDRRRTDEWFRRMNEKDCAWWMSSQIHHEAKECFSDEPQLTFERVNQQNFIKVCESVVVVYKKLRQIKDRDGKEVLVPSNYRTKQNIDMWSQRAIAGIPDLPRVMLGYEFTHELTQIRCYLGMPSGSNEKFRWHREIDMPMLFDDGLGEDTSAEPDPYERIGFEIVEINDHSTERRG